MLFKVGRPGQTFSTDRTKGLTVSPSGVELLVSYLGSRVGESFFTLRALVGFEAQMNVCMSGQTGLASKLLATKIASIHQATVLFHVQIERRT